MIKSELFIIGKGKLMTCSCVRIGFDWVLLGALATVLWGCSGSKGGDSSQGGGSAASNVDLVLLSSSLSSSLNASADRYAAMAGTNCSVTTDVGGTETGKCYSALQIKGYFNSLTLGATSGGAGVRLLGGGSLTGLEAVFSRAAFDLKTSPAIEGEDNIQDGTSSSYNLMTIKIQALEYSFVGTSANKYYHVRIPFVTTPPSASSVYANCGLGGGLAEADTLGTLYPNLTAYPGDILVCIKNTSSETCADADYQWVESSGATASVRPSSPLRLTGNYLYVEDETCDMSGATPSVNWGAVGLDILLQSPVSVSASINGGVKTYTSGGTSGNKLTVNIDIDSDGAIFVPSSAIGPDLSSATESQILQNLASIQVSAIYVKNRKNNGAPGTGDLSASVSLSVTSE